MSCEVTIIFPFSVLLAWVFIIQLCLRRGIKFTTHVHNDIAIVTFFLEIVYMGCEAEKRNDSLKEEKELYL